jgi:hypothetical protein
MRVPLLLLALGLVAAPATATPFTWQVVGTITNIQNQSWADAAGYGGAFAPGQSFAWTITMDSDAPDFDPRPSCGAYAPITAMSFDSGPVHLATTTAPGQDYLVNDAAPGGGCTPPIDDYARIRSDFGTNLFLSMHVGGLFPTDALALSATGFSGGSLDLLVGGPGGPGSYGIASASVTSITSSIPEPGGLFALGLLWVLRRRKPAAGPASPS